MIHTPHTLESFLTLCNEHQIHTVEIAAPDTQGHLRGKRVPVDRFFATCVHKGVNIADAMFVFDMQNDLPDNEFVNMETGYLDACLMPDVSTGRLLTHRPGYALVFSDAFGEDGKPHPLSPRAVLAKQIERCREQGLDPFVATELEFYLCDADWDRVQNHIQYSSLTDALELEEVIADMRAALAGAGIEVEGSNAEYGPGQIEINCGPADAMTTADNTVLYKSIVRQVAVQHGLRATFMPKPFTEESGSGMHVHTSLNAEGVNAFADAQHLPNELMAQWTAGQLAHAPAMSLISAPTVNGPKRVRPYTFAPTHVLWGLDNRTVLARCVVAPGSSANRVEFRQAGSDANPYLMLAAILAAGSDGLSQALELPAMTEGDGYTNPGEATALATNLAGAIEAFKGSTLAGLLGDDFAASYVSLAQAEVALAAEHSPDVDEVNDWERARFLEFS
ncbi:MAG: glutamine synthetase [Actinobacteria bacterium]|jgi:glutamine synthetase|nr:glutamine synthetase [Actinomycetota bacterium]MBT3746897.1 glutamine synthetase [Actinomycetota bacterium]MBT3970230.1 glutamine synthetase [Actinomycetota bacterium]MBT4010153.1 glutamine synthetase [Actinomycetota bacterium]MBT4303076.1 glutamine synthetase [Actinomycetota bacterium]